VTPGRISTLSSRSWPGLAACASKTRARKRGRRDGPRAGIGVRGPQRTPGPEPPDARALLAAELRRAETSSTTGKNETATTERPQAGSGEPSRRGAYARIRRRGRAQASCAALADRGEAEVGSGPLRPGVLLQGPRARRSVGSSSALIEAPQGEARRGLQRGGALRVEGRSRGHRQVRGERRSRRWRRGSSPARARRRRGDAWRTSRREAKIREGRRSYALTRAADGSAGPRPSNEAGSTHRPRGARPAERPRPGSRGRDRAPRRARPARGSSRPRARTRRGPTAPSSASGSCDPGSFFGGRATRTAARARSKLPSVGQRLLVRQ